MCQSEGKQIFLSALIKGFRKLQTLGTGLNDLTSALRLFLQDPGQVPPFHKDFLRPCATLAVSQSNPLILQIEETEAQGGTWAGF